MPARRIVLIDAHPDPEPSHFVHALCGAYGEAAVAAGQEVRRIDLGGLDFPLVRQPSEWMKAAPPPVIAAAQADLAWSEHVVIAYPLWLGDVPALLKGFLEQVMRPEFAFAYREGKLPAKLLKGRSARVVVTMGMPALFYRLVYGAHSVKSLERNILKFVGFGPVHHTLVGGVEDADARDKALATMRELGADAG